jgi:DNA-binding MarR family transcriptional regulator
LGETDEARLSDDYFMLWVLIAQTKDAISKARHREYARFGISTERRAILFAILNNGGRATPVEITRHLFRELHSITEMLKRMEADGLILRAKGSGKSKVEVSITDKGIEVFNQSLYNEADPRIFSVLSKKELEGLASGLRKLRSRALEDLGMREWQLKYPLSGRVLGADENGMAQPTRTGS